jgi:murein L,D-transpeptidase YcbB/YkuD
MLGTRVDRLFASTALLLVLTAAGTAGQAWAQTTDAAGQAATAQAPATDTPVVPTPTSQADPTPKAADSPATNAAAATASDAASAAKASTPQDSAANTGVAPTTPPAPAAADSKAADSKAADGKPADTNPADAAASATKPADSNAATNETAPAATPAPTNQASAPAPAAATPAPTNQASAPAPAAATPSTPAAAETAPASPAPADTAAAPAAPVVATGPDAPVAELLHGLADGKFDSVVGGKKDRAAIDAFYAARGYQPIWITDGKANARATSAIAYLGHVDADGLDPADYPAPNFASAATPADLANAEMQLTASVLAYAHHASVGRVHWSRVSPDILFTTTAPEPGDVLNTVATASDVGSALDGYEPKTAGYLALKQKLAEMRGGKLDAGNDTTIAGGPVLKVGMQDDRVPTLRDRLGVTGDGTTYDKTLADAVKKFQQQRQLSATGTLTAATLDALNGKKTPDHATDIVIANMERWRWMPHQFPNSYVIVNLPDFTLRVMHDGKPIWTTRIVIGKPEMPTPIMTAEMKYITVNPTWNVPPSIVNREYLPALHQDPTVLERMGLRVSHNSDGTIHISQPPGDHNALGRIRFNFPNKFLVYQHDTPDKYMFAYDKRAFSHGCMRVQDPPRYAEVLLSLVRPDDGYSEERIKKMIAAGSETDIQFPSSNYILVNLTYQTAFVDDAGKLEFREDVYGRDRALIALLKGDDRKVADVAVEHKIDAVHREVLAVPDQPSLFSNRGLFGSGTRYASGGNAGGDNFFARLFGGFGAAPTPPQPVPVHRPPVHNRKVTRSGDSVER